MPRQVREQLEGGQGYGRTAVNGVLRHNDRINTVQRLMHSFKKVDRFLQQKNGSEEAMIERMLKLEA